MKTISIYIRVKNEAKSLDETLTQVKKQQGCKFDIVILDNESTDGTADVALKHGAKVEKISATEFSYGRALNQSLTYTTGDIVVFLSAHSPPLDDRWLQKLTEPIIQNKSDVTFGRQVPIAGVNVYEEWFVLRAFPRKPNKFLQLIGLQKIDYSNANTALTRAILEKYPFREDLPFAEDHEWEQRMKNESVRIQYCPTAAVYHSHEFNDLADLRKRMINVGTTMRLRGLGKVYGNLFSYWAIFCLIVMTDLLFCLIRGYMGKIKQIYPYRKAFFEGIREGLLNPQ